MNGKQKTAHHTHTQENYSVFLKRLPLHEHVLGVSKLLERGHDGELDHGGRPAQKNLRVFSRRRHVFLDHLGGDEPGVVRPLRPGSVSQSVSQSSSSSFSFTFVRLEDGA